MSLKKPKTLRKCSENLQHQMPELQFFKKRSFFLALFKSDKIEYILASFFFLFRIVFPSLLIVVQSSTSVKPN